MYINPYIYTELALYLHCAESEQMSKAFRVEFPSGEDICIYTYICVNINILICITT